MAIVGSQWLTLLGFLALLQAVNISGLVCHVCVHNTATGLEADCGKGKPLPCDSYIDDRDAVAVQLESHLKSTLHLVRPARAVGYVCFTIVAARQGATVTTRGCIPASARQSEFDRANCSSSGIHNCTFCDADLVGRKVKACNSGVNPKLDLKADFDCHICGYSSASGAADTCGSRIPLPCNLGAVLATNAALRSWQIQTTVGVEPGGAGGGDPDDYTCIKAVQEKNGVTNILRGCVRSPVEAQKLCTKNCAECNFCQGPLRKDDNDHRGRSSCNAGDITKTGDIAKIAACKSTNIGASQKSSSGDRSRGLNSVLVLIGAAYFLALFWDRTVRTIPCS